MPACAGMTCSFAWSNGQTMGIRYHRERGVILGGASPKGNIGYAIGW
jgi:hypothetical protein